MYDPIMNVLHDSRNGKAPGWKRVLAGSLCGVMGALSCNPFELVKTRFVFGLLVLVYWILHLVFGFWFCLDVVYLFCSILLICLSFCLDL